MFAELLAEGRVQEPEKQRSYLNIITAETARLTRLINNVLDFSRMERGEKEYHFAPCDLVGLARETADVFRPHLEVAGFCFQTELPDSPITIRADKDAVAQVIVNLLSNAEKYTNGKKEIELQLKRHLEPVSWVELTVLDRGPGVPRESQERIFEKFYRANDSLTNNVQGSGLGLTLARQIARAHGGDVVYTPREGGGSCFTLRLPVQHKSENET
jgi:signal transduction histidine kinase